MAILSVFTSVIQFLGAAFAVLMVIVLLVTIFKSMHNKDLSDLITSDGTNKVSHSKFWANISYLVVTIVFLKVNFEPEYINYLPEFWLIYLGVVAANANTSKWISMKYKKQDSNSEKNEV